MWVCCAEREHLCVWVAVRLSMGVHLCVGWVSCCGWVGCSETGAEIKSLPPGLCHGGLMLLRTLPAPQGYPDVYVASVCLDANYGQVRAVRPAFRLACVCAAGCTAPVGPRLLSLHPAQASKHPPTTTITNTHTPSLSCPAGGKGVCRGGGAQGPFPHPRLLALRHARHLLHGHLRHRRQAGRGLGLLAAVPLPGIYWCGGI